MQRNSQSFIQEDILGLLSKLLVHNLSRLCMVFKNMTEEMEIHVKFSWILAVIHNKCVPINMPVVHHLDGGECKIYHKFGY